MLSSTGTPLRNGYTTGSCAATAAKIAMALLTHHPLEPGDDITICLPSGDALTIPVFSAENRESGSALGAVIKDAGDDQDVTHGLTIQARVTLTDRPFCVEIRGGEGVGTVTKEGLQVPVGAPAINPVPLKMIEANVKELLPKDKGCIVEVIIPEGAAVAEKTFNPRLGIVGGISVIGTTGIVRPMSEEAFKQTIFTELNQKYALGVKHLVLVPGMHGEKYANQHLGIDSSRIVHCSNFVGYALKASEGLAFDSVLLLGHIGKLIKLAGGIFQTHSKVADAKKEILIAYLALERAPYDVLQKIASCNTTDEMSNTLVETPYAYAFQALCERAREKCQAHAPTLAAIDVIFYDMALRKLGDTRKEPS